MKCFSILTFEDEVSTHAPLADLLVFHFENGRIK